MIFKNLKDSELDNAKYKTKKQWRFYKKYNNWEKSIIQDTNIPEKTLLRYYENNYNSEEFGKIPFLTEDDWDKVNLEFENYYDNANIQEKGFERTIIQQITSNCSKKKNIKNYNPIKKIEKREILKLHSLEENLIKARKTNPISPISYSNKLYYELLDQLYMRDIKENDKNIEKIIRNLYYRDGRFKNKEDIIKNYWKNSRIRVNCSTKLQKGSETLIPVGEISKKSLGLSYWNTSIPEFNLTSGNLKDNIEENIFEEIIIPNELNARVQYININKFGFESLTGDLVILADAKVNVDKIPKNIKSNWKYSETTSFKNTNEKSILPSSLVGIDKLD